MVCSQEDFLHLKRVFAPNVMIVAGHPDICTWPANLICVSHWRLRGMLEAFTPNLRHDSYSKTVLPATFVFGSRIS